MNDDKFVFFWGGPFSNWYPVQFELDGVKYNCEEQHMMAMKAKHFGDTESLDKIMVAKDPRIQKALGRKVKNFNPDEWAKVARDYVFAGLFAKFAHPDLKRVLLATVDKEIVEASPYDKIWGIAMGEDDPDRFDKTKWRGTNWLGEVLMEVREVYRK